MANQAQERIETRLYFLEFFRLEIGKMGKFVTGKTFCQKNTF